MFRGVPAPAVTLSPDLSPRARWTLDQLVAAAGFEILHLWTDGDDQFWVAFLAAA